MKTLSLAMIVKNEEHNIGRCLESVKDLFDEIIIVDTGSTDNTKKICLEYTNKVYDLTWIDDFSYARNYAFEQATSDYIMWLDADDVIEKKQLHLLKDLKSKLATQDVIMLLYKYNELKYYRERIIKNNKTFKWVGKVHEVITPSGKVEYYPIYITHKKDKSNNSSDRNLLIYEKILSQGELSARDQFYYARELFYHHRYHDAIIYFEKFLNNEQGWYVNKIDACLLLYYCYKANNVAAINYLLKSFEYGYPHNDICYEIGNYFFEKNNLKTAIYWYQCALNCKNENEDGSFVNENINFQTNIQLCVAYYKLNDREKSYKYHLKAKKINPDDPIIKYNDLFFTNFK